MPLATPDILSEEFDVCIVGAGPGGLACAFACHDQGLKVLVLDAGGERPIPGSPDILAAEITNTNAHDPVEIVAAAALGGSSHWWGGRCIALDPVDFRNWPITWEEMLPWWRRAAELVGAGLLVEEAAPGEFANLAQFDARPAECWAPQRVLSRHWRQRLRNASGPAILLGARVVGLNHANGSITSVDVSTPAGNRQVRTPRLVLSCGGLGTMRLMLLAQRSAPYLFGGRGGPLGRGYMGHLTGSIADLVFNNRQHARAFNIFRADAGCLARRRIVPRSRTVESNAIPNVAFWIENPAQGSARHGSAAASARYLAAYAVRRFAKRLNGQAPPPLQPHFANVARAPWTAVTGLTSAAWGLATARVAPQTYLPPGYLSSGANGWRLVYHSEQFSDPSNRVTLSEEKDSAGLPKLHIDFRFGDRDVDGVVRAHALLDRDLQEAGAGRLRWTNDDPQSLVAAAARDGYHQIGGTIMGAKSSASVVDLQCRVHGLNNMWVASSSVFPTSGQANPTLTIIAMGCRVAEQVARSAKRELTAAPSMPVPQTGAAATSGQPAT
ncbi:MAG TPA: GMC family oxidoreductase [Hyphomonadaceae bacterium]|nr:GMC family oxidoreductase [Hyphomonadaceae bacterium]